MTLRTLADVGFALGYNVKVQFEPRSAAGEWRALDGALLAQRRASLIGSEIDLCNDGQWHPGRPLQAVEHAVAA